MNVLLHALSTYLVYTLGRVILPHPAHVTAALLFAVHPVHCEATASIVGRADILANIFFILSFLCYVRHVDLRLRNRADIALRKRYTTNNNHIGDKSCKLRMYGDFNCDSFSKRLYQLLRIDVPYPNEVETMSNNFRRFYAIGEWITLMGSIALAVLAMLSKETGLTVLAVCATYDIVKTRHVKYKVRNYK